MHEAGDLHPGMQLTGKFKRNESAADVDGVLQRIAEAFREKMEKRERILGGDGGVDVYGGDEIDIK